MSTLQRPSPRIDRPPPRQARQGKASERKDMFRGLTNMFSRCVDRQARWMTSPMPFGALTAPNSATRTPQQNVACFRARCSRRAVEDSLASESAHAVRRGGGTRSRSRSHTRCPCNCYRSHRRLFSFPRATGLPSRSRWQPWRLVLAQTRADVATRRKPSDHSDDHRRR